MQIFIHRDGQQYGPYPIERVPGYIASGDLLPSDLAWHEGAADWMPLGQVPGVAPTPAPQHAWVPPRRDGGPAATLAGREERFHNLPAPTFIPEAYKPSPVVAPDYVQPVTRQPKTGLSKLKKMQRSAATRNMAIGAFFCIGGMVGTYYSYGPDATTLADGVFFSACIVILLGAIRFATAVIQFFRV
jgi:GYF domain 2